MQIRAGVESDIPQIVLLLKLSLGESLMPKSETFWRWKHVDNPFGKSPVLVAEEGGELVGVRAFMRWEWRQGEKIFRAVRAVDTATHPHWQGKGIFTRLSLHLAEQCKNEGIDFIFNTPNKISKPGYLKMGWEQVGRLPVQMAVNLIPRKQMVEGSNSWEMINQHPVWQVKEYSSLLTNLSPEYLLWRYRDNPNVKYELLSYSGSRPFILVYRRKRISVINEYRIVDLLCYPADVPFAIHSMKSILPLFSIITASGCLKVSNFIGLHAGPIITIKSLNLPSWKEKINFTNWAPSLGDLELF
jgi:GNAT superfamily N-acetyltransferase